MAQTELSLENLAQIVEDRVRERMLSAVEKHILEDIKPRIRQIAEDTVNQTIGQARVYFEKDIRFGDMNVQIVFPGVRDGN